MAGGPLSRAGAAGPPDPVSRSDYGRPPPGPAQPQARAGGRQASWRPDSPVRMRRAWSGV
ncbi:hypothetical protein ACFFX0_04400 [Citricoccus parietis]|uniref:Uncharacterized protein n=1 Tax=Citricoccus parietis TaxID=592307 RepID=A0ABV5FUY3_9MICC